MQGSEPIFDAERQVIMSYHLRTIDREGLISLFHGRMPLDFPEAEIKPLSLLLSLYDRGLNRSLVLSDGTQSLAYAILEKPLFGDVWLLDYLAVDGEARGRGIGSEVLSRLPAAVPEATAILAEIERIDAAEDEESRETRIRRKRFYLRNGLDETGVYTRADGGLDYEILSLPCRAHLTEDDVRAAMRRLYETLFPDGDYAILDPALNV